MAYDNPRIMRTTFPFTNADATFAIAKGPKGKKGRLYNYGVYGVSTTFAGATTTPTMSVGTSGDHDAYGDEFDFSTLAAGTSKSIRSTYRPEQAGFATYILNQGELPADTDIVAAWTAATGGGAAGVGIGFVDIQWNN
jgi:hypothetical protein